MESAFHQPRTSGACYIYLFRTHERPVVFVMEAYWMELVVLEKGKRKESDQ